MISRLIWNVNHDDSRSLVLRVWDRGQSVTTLTPHYPYTHTAPLEEEKEMTVSFRLVSSSQEVSLCTLTPPSGYHMGWGSWKGMIKYGNTLSYLEKKENLKTICTHIVHETLPATFIFTNWGFNVFGCIDPS